MSRRTVSLPTGLAVTIRPGSPRGYRALETCFAPSEAAELRQVAPDGDLAKLTEAHLSPAQYERWKDAWLEFICACCVRPRLTVEPTDRPGELWWDDLEPEDWDRLHEEVQKFIAEKKTDSTRSSATIRPTSNDTPSPRPTAVDPPTSSGKPDSGLTGTNG